MHVTVMCAKKKSLPLSVTEVHLNIYKSHSDNEYESHLHIFPMIHKFTYIQL